MQTKSNVSRTKKNPFTQRGYVNWESELPASWADLKTDNSPELPVAFPYIARPYLICKSWV